MARLEELAINGGPKAKKHPYGVGPKHLVAELKAVKKILERGAIQFARGPEVMELREKLCKLYGAKHCITTSSGTAAIHTALGALGIGRGDEVVTSSWSDMGTYIAILQQNAVPVLADVDPFSGNMTPESVEKRITRHTKAILVVHLEGNPCDMAKIMKIARKRKLLVVEDLAQSYLCEYNGKKCGTFGTFGCFSVNDSKHIGAGDGGMLITNNARLADRADLFADKCYDRTGRKRDPFLVGYNYRMNLMAAGVALEQMKNLKRLCARRHRLGEKLTKLISGLPAVTPHKVLPKAHCTYWHYAFHVDPGAIKVSMAEFVKAMRAEGVSASPMSRLVPQWPIFRDKVRSPHACAWSCPLYKGKVDYSLKNFPGLQTLAAGGFRMGLNEHWTDRDVVEVAKGIRKVALHYAK
ncbi:MAG: DegT/DnrJ/EryC1/StrS family aminotransferase [Planctomycetes bacterium]|nr:DegT/DnrJ/EryC1/StrS family aminotransferase [Planctomycetota bacterium]